MGQKGCLNTFLVDFWHFQIFSRPLAPVNGHFAKNHAFLRIFTHFRRFFVCLGPFRRPNFFFFEKNRWNPLKTTLKCSLNPPQSILGPYRKISRGRKMASEALCVKWLKSAPREHIFKGPKCQGVMLVDFEVSTGSKNRFYDFQFFWKKKEKKVDFAPWGMTLFASAWLTFRCVGRFFQKSSIRPIMTPFHTKNDWGGVPWRKVGEKVIFPKLDFFDLFSATLA